MNCCYGLRLRGGALKWLRARGRLTMVSAGGKNNEKPRRDRRAERTVCFP